MDYRPVRVAPCRKRLQSVTTSTVRISSLVASAMNRGKNWPMLCNSGRRIGGPGLNPDSVSFPAEYSGGFRKPAGDLFKWGIGNLKPRFASCPWLKTKCCEPENGVNDCLMGCMVAEKLGHAD